MRKITSLLVTALLAVFVFSCQLPKSSTPGEVASLTLEQKINQKYPGWKVKPAGFENDGNGITDDEIKFMLRTMARMRLLVNSEEFKNGFLQPDYVYPCYIFVKKVTDCPQSPWVVNDYWGSPDYNRAFETLYEAEGKIIIVKMNEDRTMYGDLGEPAYTYLGYKDSWWYGERIYLMNRTWHETCFFGKYKYFVEGTMHEYMHLLGYGHEPNHNGIPNQAEKAVRGSFDAVINNYPEELKELEDYYMTFFDEMKASMGTGSGGSPSID